MTTSTVLDLFHVFLVEDEEGLNKDLKSLIEIEIPRCAVTSALCISQAFEKLNRPELPAIDLALLDLRLPETPGATKIIHPRLSNKMKDLGVPSVLMTGYVGSEDVDAFIKDRKLHDPPLKVISKRQMDVFVDLVLDTIREFLVRKSSSAVLKRFGEVFGAAGRSSGYRSSTAELMSLQRQIIDYWQYLSPEVRDEVRRRFSVTEDSDGSCSLNMILAGL